MNETSIQVPCESYTQIGDVLDYILSEIEVQPELFYLFGIMEIQDDKEDYIEMRYLEVSLRIFDIIG
jgi:hypothetical protein